MKITCDKTIIFSITAGRSGSKYLANLLDAIPGVHAEHEPKPNFLHVMRRAQHNPSLALSFLRDHKLPVISNVAEPIYAETSHLTCKGFIEPMIMLGLRPSLILLRRPPRQVAFSLLERLTVPARTQLGLTYLLEPRDPFVLPLLGWENLTDYQLCFWYALEIERRCLHYAAMANRLGLALTDVTNEELNNWSIFSRLLSDLNLPSTDKVRESHARISAESHNINLRKLKKRSQDELAASEEDVWDRIVYFEPLLRQDILARYGSELTQAQASDQ